MSKIELKLDAEVAVRRQTGLGEMMSFRGSERRIEEETWLAETFLCWTGGGIAAGAVSCEGSSLRSHQRDCSHHGVAGDVASGYLFKASTGEPGVTCNCDNLSLFALAGLSVLRSTIDNDCTRSKPKSCPFAIIASLMGQLHPVVYMALFEVVVQA